MRTVAISMVAAAALAACGDEAFDDGFPDGEVLKIKVPEGSQTQGLTADGYGVRQDDLAGDRANFYTLTREVTKGVNGGVLWVLGMVKAITRRPPTSRDGNVRVWGPGSDPLDPNIIKLTVEHVKDQTFKYQLEGKKKAAGDDAWAVLISGEHTRSGKPGRGTGTFTLDFDKMRASIETQDDTVGAITADYDSSGEGVSLAVHFKQVMDKESGARVDAEYRYRENAVRDGTFQFAIDKNINDTPTAAREHMTIQSRWYNTGAGRSDIRASGGDLGTAEATATECWSTLFASEYLTCSWGGCNGWGTANLCTYAGEPSYSAL